MTSLKSIEEIEESSNAAFKQWMDSPQFHFVANSLKDELIIYVSALQHEIADLKANNALLEKKFRIALNNVPATVQFRLRLQMAEMQLKEME